ERNVPAPTTLIRTPAVVRVERAGPPPASSIGQSVGRQGPRRPTAVAGSQRPSGAMAAGRTTTPPMRAGFKASTAVAGPRPGCARTRLACRVTAGVSGPVHVRRAVRSTCDVRFRTARAAWSPTITDSAATAPAKATVSAIARLGIAQRPGRRRARARTSVSGPRTPPTSAAPLPGVVRPRLLSPAADVHRTPAPGVVAGVVVEGPAAVSTGTHLETLPAAVDHRLGQNRQQRAKGPVDSGGADGHQFRPVGRQAQLQRCAGECPVEL